MPTATITWRGTITAISSLAHGGSTRGTITMLRREAVIQPDGTVVHVPVISGNAFRARLRRTGEELLRDALSYEHQLPRSTAAALRGGGALAKTTGEPLSGHRLQSLRHLVPHVGVFGCVGGGTIIEGALKVGKVQPHLVETAHLTGDTAGLSAFEATQLESYARGDDADSHALADLGHSPVPLTADGRPDDDRLDRAHAPNTTLMLYSIETFPAGTRFSTWLRLDRATGLEIAFFTDVLDTFSNQGWLGGRSAIGHGQVRADLNQTTIAGTPPDPLPDWRAHLKSNRDDALTALEALT